MFFAILTMLLTVALPAQADYVAYSKSENSRLPLPENLDTVDVKFLVNVEWGDHRGNKTRVGVLPVENTSSTTTFNIGGNTATYSGSGVPVQGIEAIISDTMLRSKRFRVVERSVLDQAIREQDLGAQGRMAKPSAAKVGKILGAEYLVQGVVTHYEAGVEESGGGLGGLIGGSAGALLGGLAVKSSKAIIGMNFRLIDAETSEIVFSKQVQVDLSESGLTFGGLGIGGSGALGGFLSSYSKTPIGQAVIAAINKGVYSLIQETNNSKLSGSVIKAKGNQVYINLGADVVNVGDRLDLIDKGEELIDPDTGLSLGGESENIGSVQITSTKEKYSIAKPVSGTSTKKIKRGTKVVSTAPAQRLEYASQWNPPSTGSWYKADDNVMDTGSSDNF